MKTELYQYIISLLPSQTLKTHLSETAYAVSEIDLLRIVFQYAKSFDEQITLFAELYQEYENEESRKLAELCKKHLSDAKSAFEDNNNECVYELCIIGSLDVKSRLFREDCTERYLCHTIEDAIKLIPLFCQEYEITETDEACYRILKHRIFGTKSNPTARQMFENGIISECEYRKDGLLYRVESNDSIQCDFDGVCQDCNKLCHFRIEWATPFFPPHVSYGDIISYIDYNGDTRHGFVAAPTSDLEFEYVIIPLDIENYTSDEIFKHHRHLPVAEVERISPDELTETERIHVQILKK